MPHTIMDAERLAFELEMLGGGIPVFDSVAGAARAMSAISAYRAVTGSQPAAEDRKVPRP